MYVDETVFFQYLKDHPSQRGLIIKVISRPEAREIAAAMPASLLKDIVTFGAGLGDKMMAAAEGDP